MSMRSGNARYSADPVDAGAQSDLICAPRLVIVEDSPVAPNGGSVSVRSRLAVPNNHGIPGSLM